MTVDDLQNM